MSRERVCALSDLEVNEAIQVIVDTEMVAVVLDESGDVHAVGDMCTHAAVSLSEGEVENCMIECWLHGSRFDLRTGAPTSLPAVTPVDVFAVSVDGDDVFVDTDVIVNATPAAADQAAASKEN